MEVNYAMSSLWFEDLPVLGRLSLVEAAAKLREMDEDGAALALDATQRQAAHQMRTFEQPRGWWPFQDKPWQHTAHAFGFLAPASPCSAHLPIQHAGNITPDLTLKNSRIKITLSRLRVAAYPGSGTHRVLFDFYAQNQLPSEVEHLHFNAILRVREGEQAAIAGYPIFVGLNVGTEGVAFKCYTVNVKNDADEAFLGFLDSDIFRSGLKLATTVQPAIGLLSQTTLALTKAVASRNRNIGVQEFYMGLDFSNIAMGARLAEGSYLAVQIPETLQAVWDWTEWVYNPANGQVVNKMDPTRLIPYNYIVFSVSRYN
jgi:hypothetical protein